MKTALKITLLTLGLSTLATAHAGEGFYAGVAGAKVEFKEGGVPDIKPSAVFLKAGYQFNDYFAAEARAGSGVSSQSATVSGIKVSYDVDYFAGLYGKVMLPVSTQFSLYGLAGYTAGKVTTDVGTTSTSDTRNDYSYGAGVDFTAAKTGPFSLLSGVTINLEWARLYSKDGLNISTFSLGVNHSF